MKLAYIILAHQHPKLIIRLVKHLIANGSIVALHYDLNSGSKDFVLIQQELAEYSAFVLYAERIKVAWGEWSIVQATLNALNKLAALESPPDYVHLMSGMDYPTRPEEELRTFLARNYGKEFIQAVDINHQKWITGGLSKERFQYRHYFNWQHHPKIFDWNYSLQHKFLPKRKFPKGLTPHMGSQWWTLTWPTCAALLERSKDAQLIKFFRTVWIPDEMYIQTLVAATVGKSQIVGKCLTLYQFNRNGVPLVFTNGHQDYLMRQPFFFARKISPYAEQLRDALDFCYTGGQVKPLSLLDENLGITTKEYDFFLKKNEINNQKGRRIIGLVRDAWYGDLEWNDKPYYIIAGGALSELKIVQEFLNQQPGIICHGNLFSPQQINFISDSEFYAGFNSIDTALRDHSRQNFLTQVIRHDLDKIVAFLLPFDEAEALFDVCLWDKNSRIIVLKTNPFLIYRDHESEINSAAFLTAEEQFLAFWEIYRKFREKHEEFWQKLHSAWKVNREICLYEDGLNWTKQLLEFIEINEIEDQKELKPVGDKKNLLGRYLPPKKLLCKISPYAKLLKNEFDHCYLEKRTPLLTKKIIDIIQYGWYGDLEWNDKPYYIIAGGALSELKIVQEFLNQQPGIICHGNLFSPQQINFISDSEFYAGFNSIDTALRDHSRQNFLTQVIRHDLDKIVAFLLPFDEAEALFDVCLWDKNSRIIVLKTNPFLIYRDHESEINSAAFLTAEEQFLAFWEIYRKFREKHEEFWQKLHSAWKVNREICLYEDGLNWTKQLLEFIEINEIEDQKELKPVGDKKNLLGRYLPPKKLLCKISPYAKLLKNEFDHCYLEKRTPLLTKKIIDIIQYGWYGDLEWNDKPYYIIAGGALSELKIVQEFLNQQPGIICHGNLFSPQQINFISDSEFYAGFNSIDTALRDHSRQNFLTQVIRHDLDKIVAFLLPFDEAEALFDVCLWDKNSRIIVLKTNPFLIYRDHESEINSATLLADEKKFTIFWDQYHLFRQRHEDFWQKLHNAWKPHLEICLYDAEHPWTNQLLNFVNKMERETAREKGKSFETVLINNKLTKRIDTKEYKIWLSKYNYRETTLAENNKPYYVVVGGSKMELKLIQDFLNQQAGIVCHGDLFSPQQINFVNGLNDYAGLNYQDIALRDYNRQNFLFQLIQNDIDKIVVFLVPFSTSGKILDICLWDKNARIIPLKSNPFLLYREYEQEIDISAIWTVNRENQNIANPTVYFNLLRAAAFMDLFKKFYYQQHQKFWYSLYHANPKNCEICLYDIRKSWTSELLDFIYRMEFEKEQEIFDLAKQIVVAGIKNKKRFLRYITPKKSDIWIDRYYDLYGDTKQMAKLFFNLSSHDQDIIAEYAFFRGNVIWQNMKFLE